MKARLETSEKRVSCADLNLQAEAPLHEGEQGPLVQKAKGVGAFLCIITMHIEEQRRPLVTSESAML